MFALRTSDGAFAALKGVVIQDAAGVCGLTRGPLGDDGEVDHSVELAVVNDVAEYAFKGAPAAAQNHAARVLTEVCNARSNLRALSRAAHSEKSNMMKRLRRDLKSALKDKRPVAALAALNAAVEPGLDATALRTVQHDHRALAATIDTIASDGGEGALDQCARGLRVVADVLRAIVADEFSHLWSPSGDATVVRTHAKQS